TLPSHVSHMPSQNRQCVVCCAPISKMQLGIDACRACATCYKRATLMKRAFKCKSGDHNCLVRKPIPSCRACRYDRIARILATAEEDVSGRSSSTSSREEVEETKQPEEEESSSFIDHTSYFADGPSTDNTVLQRIERAYSMMCVIRNAGEMGNGVLLKQEPSSVLKRGNINFVPMVYPTVISNCAIFYCALIEFAKAAFDDFKALSEEVQILIVKESFHVFNGLDGNYRAVHHFPNDDTVTSTYSMYCNAATVPDFFDDRQQEFNKDEALTVLMKSGERNALADKRNFERIRPSKDEFCALLGLSLWSEQTARLSEELMVISTRNRSRILADLHKIYARRGKSNYATRLGELMCILVKFEKMSTIQDEDLEVCRLMKIFP
ncbi:hypothetical protein PFISCL1PPCAC_13235, partial [Pristionchus fissidentatus]